MTSEHTPQQVLHDPAIGLPAEDVAAVHAYAGAFCGRPATAAELAGEVLTGQQGPAARPALLADVRRTAFGWLRDSRSRLLHRDFREWAQRAGETFGTTDTLRLVEHDAPLLRAFGELADQSRAALWLCLAEGEPAFAARVLNTSQEFAESMAESARSRLADTFLRLRAEHTADARCVHYGGMLGAIARGTHRETPADLEQHLETCEFCAHDITLLRTLTSGGTQELRPLLVDRLLVWGGPAYRAVRPAAPDAAAKLLTSDTPSATGAPNAPSAPLALGAPPPAPPTPTEPRPADPGPRRPVLAIAVAVVVTAAATAVALHLLSGVGQSERSAGSYGPPPAGPPRSPAASPSVSQGVGTVLATVALTSAAGPGTCVGAAAGEALDGIPAPGACDGGTTQRWRVVDIGDGAVALQHVASTFCLDIAGDRAVGDPMQLRPCAYAQGDAAPYPEDQAFLLKAHQDRTFTLVCQDKPAIAVGITNGEIRMLPAGTSGAATRFALDDDLDKALGN
ncbi:RICIN domain-containing protein [Streptomyces sp. NBC_00882]|uniref:RICIN domain-containing protein n=1 Tax=Streptomyces sp. NBC_00882 TaxID=2975856 RepID=UPI003867EB4B|nr:RICIN domain-containing protein [Streptomyces sp. NBC_00882]